MGVYANTVSITQFTVTGDLPKQDQFQWFSEKLAGRGFQSIENSTEEVSEGWVQVDRPDEAAFAAPSDFWRDNYLVFSLRRDQRKIPASVLKSHTGREEGAFLSQHPNLRRTPKKKREEIKEQVQLKLMSRCLPVPSTVDVVWDQKSGVLTLFSLGSKVVERFEDIFRKCFEGFHPVAIHPFARARMLLEGQLLDKLEGANQANSDSVIALIRDNQWLGWDFMLWLLQRGVNGEGEFTVSRPGHFTAGERFSAWIDDKIQLQGGGEEGGIQKVSVSGSQDSYLEAISALKGGKQITSATICMEKDENLWKLTLKGETFGFAGFKCPQVRIERDATVEEMSEREAAFYERMYLLEQGVQMFDSLFATFLQERLSDAWNGRMKAIQEWLDGKQQPE
ncbi:recombination-associated protein RdgC [Geobacter sp. SVR]|uniref:recombination-associated protein RdgC n=1 Tax=Geobacter sp. SVR TaxID=2495594 RepID=UPI00143F0120|nr:recombination-associated protein RdgC [Geobacter sp. SVR]BCS52588.1 exonuclease [Geobacter sp. SVR]GCF83974.1 exonuclease [Geobacter sp. SVR]